MSDQHVIVAWNVNRYCNKIHKWFKKFLEDKTPDVVFLSETKRKVADLEKYFTELTDYNYILSVHQPTHFHGVAMLIKKKRSHTFIPTILDIPPRFDCQASTADVGRAITIYYENKYILVGTYVPNAGVNGNHEKMNYRVNKWDLGLQQWLNVCADTMPTLWFGDINVCADEIDVSNPEKQCKYAGFTFGERVAFNSMLQDEWIDVWRQQHPNVKEYSWRGKAKSNTEYGMRLDNMVACKDLAEKVLDSYMIGDCPLSDHVPIVSIFK